MMDTFIHRVLIKTFDGMTLGEVYRAACGAIPATFDQIPHAGMSVRANEPQAFVGGFKAN
ncbi:hypothetical protein D3C72_2506200 [compost metagenome]